MFTVSDRLHRRFCPDRVVDEPKDLLRNHRFKRYPGLIMGTWGAANHGLRCTLMAGVDGWLAFSMTLPNRIASVEAITRHQSLGPWRPRWAIDQQKENTYERSLHRRAE